MGNSPDHGDRGSRPKGWLAMTRLVVLLIALLGVAAQQSQSGHDADGHLTSEHQIPAGDYCKRSDVTIRTSEIHAHHCDCTYSCVVDESGRVVDTGGEKQVACKSFCSKDRRRCTCHPEGDPSVTCIGSNALMDMDGNVVAVKVRH